MEEKRGKEEEEEAEEEEVEVGEKATQPSGIHTAVREPLADHPPLDNPQLHRSIGPTSWGDLG